MNNDPNVVAVHTYLMLQSQRRVKAAQHDMKAVVAQARAVGVNFKDVQEALKEYDMSPEARREKAERQASVLQALGVPCQLEMFDTYVPRDNDDDAQARRRGWFAAICGANSDDAPYPPGSSEGQAWLDGWNDFQAALAGYFGAEAADESA